MRPIVAGRLCRVRLARCRSPTANPLAATERLLVDGTNLLHALSRTPTAAPPAALIGRLRGVDPGRDDHRARLRRADRSAACATSGSRPGVTVRYSGRRTADDVILPMIDDVRLARRRRRHGDAPGRHRRPRPAPRRRGSAARGRRARRGCSVGSIAGGSRRRRSAIPRPRRGRRDRVLRRRPRRALSSDGDPAETDRRGWKPGRGATTKKGNPKTRLPRTGGTGRMRP